jgi:hypothetical protein
LLAVRYGWTPEQMARMTVAQLVYYVEVGTCRETISIGMSREQAIALTRRKQQQREAELAALQEVLFNES